MHWQRLRHILHAILESPTAPFHEYHVRDTILGLLGELSHVVVREDDFGNLIVTYRRGRKRAQFAFGAHMDHPGWIRRPGEGEDGADGWDFLGGVPPEYLVDPVIEEFGAFGMWELPAIAIREGMIYSRACDDLINCATMVALLEGLERSGAEAACHCVFTRAEEVGFVGAVKLAKAWPFSPKTVFVSLETSSPAGEVVMGAGPVLRVGDRLSIFDDGITREIAEVARAKGIAVQRSLLDRGSCEASAVQAYGIPCAGLSILLGNYHNCGEGGRIESEYVTVEDTKSMVSLLEALVVEGASRKRGEIGAGFRRKLEERVRTYAAEAKATRGRFAGR